MDQMLPAPVMVGGEDENAGDKACDFVGPLGFEKGAMGAVMKNNKGADVKPRRQNREGNDQPPGDCKAEVTIRTHSAVKGTSVLTSCHALLQREGFWYLRTIPFHPAVCSSKLGFSGEIMDGEFMGLMLEFFKEGFSRMAATAQIST